MDAFTLITRLCCPEAKGNAMSVTRRYSESPKGQKKTQSQDHHVPQDPRP